MRIIIYSLLGLLLGYAVLQIDAVDPNNYVKIFFAGYLLEMKLISLILIIFFSILAMYLVIRFLHNSLKLPRRWRRWRGRRLHSSANENFASGLFSLLKGDWSRAEKALVKNVDHCDHPSVNHLLAAQAAHHNGDSSARNAYLQKALEEVPAERVAVGLLKTDLHMKNKEHAEALATLDDIDAEGSSLTAYKAQRLLCLAELERWPEAFALIDPVRKRRGLPEPEIDALQHRVTKQLLLGAADVKTAWKKLPKESKQNEEYVNIYADFLISSGQAEDAEKLLRKALDHQWSEILINQYGDLRLQSEKKRLRHIERWLANHADSPSLYTAAARIALRSEESEHVEEWLNKAYALKPTAEVRCQLAESRLKRGDQEGAMQALGQRATT